MELSLLMLLIIKFRNLLKNLKLELLLLMKMLLLFLN
nr:MAG TPA: hypothetical protein [Caudoviricetes sp.]